MHDLVLHDSNNNNIIKALLCVICLNNGNALMPSRSCSTSPNNSVDVAEDYLWENICRLKNTPQAGHIINVFDNLVTFPGGGGTPDIK